MKTVTSNKRLSSPLNKLNLSATKAAPKKRSKLKDKRREIMISLMWVLVSLSKM